MIVEVILMYVEENKQRLIIMNIQRQATGQFVSAPASIMDVLHPTSDFLVNKIAKGNATGDSRYALTTADKSVIDGIAYVGDVWVRVYDNDGKAVDGWTALTHKGIPQVMEKLIATTPPPAGKPASIEMILADGSVVTIEDENGNVLWSGTA